MAGAFVVCGLPVPDRHGGADVHCQSLNTGLRPARFVTFSKGAAYWFGHILIYADGYILAVHLGHTYCSATVNLAHTENRSPNCVLGASDIGFPVRFLAASRPPAGDLPCRRITL